MLSAFSLFSVNKSIYTVATSLKLESKTVEFVSLHHM